jgi:hypothetical protein
MWGFGSPSLNEASSLEANWKSIFFAHVVLFLELYALSEKALEFKNIFWQKELGRIFFVRCFNAKGYYFDAET